MKKTLFTSGHGHLQSVTVEFDKNVLRAAKRFRCNYQGNQQKDYRKLGVLHHLSFPIADFWPSVAAF